MTLKPIKLKCSCRTSKINLLPENECFINDLASLWIFYFCVLFVKSVNNSGLKECNYHINQSQLLGRSVLSVWNFLGQNGDVSYETSQWWGVIKGGCVQGLSYSFEIFVSNVCKFHCLYTSFTGYLLPIINKLLVDKELLSRPPYAVVLLPSIELCHQARYFLKTSLMIISGLVGKRLHNV